MLGIKVKCCNSTIRSLPRVWKAPITFFIFFCQSLCITASPKDGFSCKVELVTCKKIGRQIQIWLKSDKRFLSFYLKDEVFFFFFVLLGNKIDIMADKQESSSL